MTKYITVIFFLSLIDNSFSQSWSSLNTGVNGTVNCMLSDTINNILYVGGSFTKADGKTVNGIAEWNGNSWQALGKGLIDSTMTSGNAVFALALYRGELYAAGVFDTLSGSAFNNIARWNGTNWLPVGKGVLWGGVSALTEYSGELYIGGDFAQVDGGSIISPNIVRWNGTSWLPVPGGYSQVYSLKSFNNDLYVGGDFSQAGSIYTKGIVKWNGASWAMIGSGINYANPRVMSIESHNGEVYAGGVLSSSVSKEYVTKWNGSSWMGVSNGLNKDIFVLQEINKELYAGGYIPSGSTSDIMKWNGIGWVGLNANISGGYAINCFAWLNNTLYVGGNFTSAGGVNVSNIVAYSLQAEIKENKILSIAIYPNPVNEVLSIQFDEDTSNELFISVYDVCGKEVNKISAKAADANISLNMCNYEKGIYLLSIKRKEGEIIRKIIKR